jgi:TolA-binding protein
MRFSARAFVALVLALGLAAAAAVSAQTTVSSTDLQRLQDALDDASDEVGRVRGRDVTRAERLEGELAELRDEVAYLRVKVRREKNVPRSEYHDLRDSLDDLRSRARGDVPGTRPGGTAAPLPQPVGPGGAGRGGSATAGAPRGSVIPVGQEIDVRLQDPLSSDRNQVEDRFVATTVVDLMVGDRMVIPAGSEVRGVVSAVDPAGRIDRTGRMTVTFDQITVNGQTHTMRGTVIRALESSGVRGEAGRIGAGAGVGAIIGGILGGVRGALVGILVGSGGVIAATEGKDVELPVGTILRVRLDTPPAIK